MSVTESIPSIADEVARGDQTVDVKKRDNMLAERLALHIENANAGVAPICKLIRAHIENMEARKEEDRNEDELVRAVRPLLEHAEKILNETNGLVKGADMDNRLCRQAKRAVADHTSSPEEHRLAEALKVLIEEVNGTIDWAKHKLDAFPKAKNDLGPLLDALGQPLLQIVSGVGLLLAGVLNLVGKLLSGLGFHCLLDEILAAIGLDKLFKGISRSVGL